MTGTPMKAVLEEAKKKKEIKDVKAKLRLEKLMDNPKVIPKVKLKLLKNRSGNAGKIVKTKMNTHTKNKSAANRKTTKKRCSRQISFEESTSEEDIDETKLCDDEELDDGIDLLSKDTEMCLLCGEYGKKTELWCHCVHCGKWAHADCSGYDSPENYICGFYPLIFDLKKIFFVSQRVNLSYFVINNYILRLFTLCNNKTCLVK